jgi:hypothetical protein
MQLNGCDAFALWRIGGISLSQTAPRAGRPEQPEVVVARYVRCGVYR